MMRYAIFICLTSVVMIFASCSSEPEGLTISGTIEGGSALKVYIDKMSIPNSTMVIAQTEMDGNGSFDAQFEEGLEPGIYRLRVGAKNVQLIIDGTESRIEVEGKLGEMDKYDLEISGSRASEEYADAMRRYYAREMKMEDITEFLGSSKSSLAAMSMAMTALNNPQFAEMHTSVVERMQKDYPNSEYTTSYTNYHAQLMGVLAQQRARQKIQVGMPAPDIRMPDPSGNEYSLSDLKGKVVLLDFWASWCGPCRRANPHVVEIYNKYKDDGFTVFSVSLDGLDNRTKTRLQSEEAIERSLESSKKRWLSAIEKDKLAWEYHVSDLAKWDTYAAKQYGVTGIPKTFLIDRDGNIAAVNPRYNLEEALLKVL